MKASNGILSGEAARLYENSSLLPKLPGLGKAFSLPYDYCDIEKPPSSKAEKDEMALDGLVFELNSTRNPKVHLVERKPSSSFRSSYRSQIGRVRGYDGDVQSGLETGLSCREDDFTRERRTEYVGEGPIWLDAELLVFKSPEDARFGLREIIGQHKAPRSWPGQEFLATARGVLTGYKGEVDLTDSTDASHIFAKIVAHGLTTSVVHSGDPVHDVAIRFSHFERSPWRFEAVLMLSAHLAFYWHREGNHDLEARYLAIMAYRFFGDGHASRYHAMTMLKNINVVYKRMERRGKAVDSKVRDLHNTFQKIVGENHNASFDRGTKVPHWKRFPVSRSHSLRPPRYSLAHALRPHVCKSADGLCMHSSHFVDARGWGDSCFD